MRKFILTITAVLLLSYPLKAEFVRPDVAARCARDVLGMKEYPVAFDNSPMRAPARDGQNEAPEYYIFNNPQGGWVIIASDDRVNPVVGYSPEGSFSVTDMPDNIRWWMDGVAETIDAVRNSDQTASASVRAAWESLLAGAPVIEGTKKYINTALWNQSKPYNDLCPIASGENKRSVTGCIATAMGIIMQNNRWPAHGKGEIGNYTTTNNQTYIPAYDIESHVYDWNIMSDEAVINGLTDSWTTEQTFQVAQLMHDCGVSVKMDYSSESSSSSSGEMLKAMKENMSYSEKAALVSRSSYTLDKWFSLMKNEIDHGRVVYYAGAGDAGGHAFVCDGYDTNGSKLRINWGWGGVANGYFTLDLTLTDYNISFSSLQEAIIGLAPDTATVELEETTTLVFTINDGFYGIEPAWSIDLIAGSEFDFNVGWMVNNDNKAVKVEFKICLEDKDGNVRQEGWRLDMNLPEANGYMYSEKTAKSALKVNPDLTDHFRLYIKNKGRWQPMHGNYDLLPDVDGVTCGVTQDPVIMIPDDCTVGQQTELSLTQSFSPVTKVVWSINGEPLEGNSFKPVSGKNAIRADVDYLDGTKGSVFRTLQLE